MKETEMKIEPMSLTFTIQKNNWEIRIPKSQTKVKYTEQLKLITKDTDYFVPVVVNEQEDAFLLTYTVAAEYKKWDDIKKANKNEKLRALCNIANLEKVLSTRTTFFLHPNNIVFNENLMPQIIYRGIQGLIEPFEMTEDELLKQYKCFIIAMFSKEYQFDDLYNGSLSNATTTTFEREVNEKKTLHELITFLRKNYRKEQQTTDKTMQLVPKKRFRLYKQTTIWMTILLVLITSLLFYTTFIKIPYQDRLLIAHHNFIASDYSEVIHTLSNEDVEKLPHPSKYILAYSYIKVEQLSDKEKEAIMKNISLKSDKYYLLYWIYNGLGDFEQSIDIAKYMDDPQLIMYGLIKKIEQVKNDPELTGAERDEEVRKLRDELESYTEEFELLDEDENVDDEIETNKTIEDEHQEEVIEAEETEETEEDEKEVETEEKDSKKEKK